MAFPASDAAAFRCLFLLAVLFGAMSYLAYHVIHMKHVTPLGASAPLDRFSEARAIEHVRRLSVDIPGRQEGSPGLEEAAQYIKRELEKIAERAAANYRVQVEETLVSGTFNMMFLSHSVSLCYRNHKNVIMRISSKSSDDKEQSVLVNAHYDSPLGSPGAGDCGSCVASMLELARLVVDSNWIPPRPLIFLFNGAEELFLLGSHGFVKTHRWRNNIGAFIDIEASGNGGFDLVVQSGPGSWPSHIYAQSAKYPMANSVAQDVFGSGIIPGDTDYRIFAEDYGNIPGLDIIFVLGGYFYHTCYDTVDRLMPGSMQARGENLFNLIQAFANSSMVLSANGRASEVESYQSKDERAVFFDYLSLFMVYYSRKVSLVLHSLPTVVFFLMPLILHRPNTSIRSVIASSIDFLKGAIFHCVSVIFAIIIPVVFAVLRLVFSNKAMTWFDRPYLAFLMFVPSALIGLFLPRAICGFFPLSQDAQRLKVSKQDLTDEARFWGAFGLYVFITMAYLLSGLAGGFLTYLVSVFMLIAWFCYNSTSKSFGSQSLRSCAAYVIPLVPMLIYVLYYGGFLIQFVVEKMGMMGSLPQPYGYYVPDIIVAAVIGLVTGWAVGPIVPIVGHLLGRTSVLGFLTQATILALAVSSQFFPYSVNAPKRVVIQHAFTTTGPNILDSSFHFSVVDSNSLAFVFKYAPEVAKELKIESDVYFKDNYQSDGSSWVALFPISYLFSGSLKFPANTVDISMHYRDIPHLSVVESDLLSKTGNRRLHLELNLGSLSEIWVTVLNITGPLSNWSFADNKLPAPESISGGPPSYICRISGGGNEKWNFWLEANNSQSLRVDVAVLDQYLVEDAQRLKSLFPSWADVTAFSTFLSSYQL